MIYVIGFVIAFFLVLILFSKKNKSEADRILAWWLLFTGVHLFFYYIFITGKYDELPYFLGFEKPLPLVHGPFLFLYVSELTNQKGPDKFRLLHFIPLLLAIAALIPFYFLPSPDKIAVYHNEGAGYETLLLVLFSGILISGITYSVLSLFKLYKHQKNILTQFSYTEKINLLWLRYLIFGSVIIWLVVIISNDEYVFVSVTLYLIFIGYFGINQVGIFTNKSIPTDNVELINLSLPPAEAMEVSRPERIKYEKSALSQDELESIYKDLSALMQNEKLYKNPELTLPELAQKLNIHANTLSQVINTMEQCNFYDYINTQRVNEFKQALAQPDNQKFTLLALAHACGFNSKTSFNRNFKKTTGISPSEYVRQLNITVE